MPSNPLDNLHTKHHVNMHMTNALKNIMDCHPLINTDRNEMGKSFITKTKPHLSKAMDHLNGFAQTINGVEMHYQGVLDALDGDVVNLETKVKMEDLAKQHVYNLKQLHQKQKVTLTKITQLFLQLSKSQLKEMKKTGR